MRPQRSFRSCRSRARHRDGHHFGRRCDVEARLARHAARAPAQPHHDAVQRPVVHVHHPPPENAPRVNVEPVALVQVVVQHGRQQVVRRAHRREIAGEMQVDVLHRHHLRIAAARRAALHAEHRTQRGLARGADRPAAQALQRLRQPDRRRGLALPGRRWGDGGHQNQVAVRRVLPRRHRRRRDLRLGASVGLDLIAGQAHLRRHVLNGTQPRGLGNLDVGWL